MRSVATAEPEQVICFDGVLYAHKAAIVRGFSSNRLGFRIGVILQIIQRVRYFTENL